MGAALVRNTEGIAVMRQVASELAHQRIGVRLAIAELSSASSIRDARERLAALLAKLEREGDDLRGAINRSDAAIVRDGIAKATGAPPPTPPPLRQIHERQPFRMPPKRPTRPEGLDDA